MNQIGPTFVAIVTGVIGLALVAVAVSRNAQTPQVVQSAGGALASIIGAAVQPVTGSSSSGFGSAIGGLGGLSSGFGSAIGGLGGLSNFGGVLA
jgi:hypothetical protein